MIWGLWAESSKSVSRTVQTLFRTGGNSLKRVSHHARDYFGSLSLSLSPEARKHLSHPPLSTFGHFGCLGTCTRPAGVAMLVCKPTFSFIFKKKRLQINQFWSETGRIRFRRVRFQTPNSVSFLGLTEFRGANSVSSSQPIICVPKRTHRVSRRTHRVCPRTQ